MVVVLGGVGGGWHARQAHAEQNIGLIEKSALSIHAPSNRLSPQELPLLLIMYVHCVDICPLSLHVTFLIQRGGGSIGVKLFKGKNPDMSRQRSGGTCTDDEQRRTLKFSVSGFNCVVVDPSAPDGQFIYIRNPPRMKVVVGVFRLERRLECLITILV